MEGLSECITVTYSADDYNITYNYGFSLLPGYGCYIKMNRLDNGSYGTVVLTYDDPNLMIFDKYTQ